MDTYHIEQAVLVSILESSYLNTGKRIAEFHIKEEHFVHPFHRKLASAINALKKHGHPPDTDLLRASLIGKKMWSIFEDRQLEEILIHQPLGTFSTFSHYYKVLEDNYYQQADMRYAI